MISKKIYYVLLVVCLISFISVKDFLYRGYYLLVAPTQVVKASVIGKDKRDTSEGDFFDYKIGYINPVDQKTIENETSVWSELDKEYNVGDTMLVLISKRKPKVAIMVKNIDSVRFSFIVSIVLIGVFFYSGYKVLFSRVKFSDHEK
jgi:hypothetical protein